MRALFCFGLLCTLPVWAAPPGIIGHNGTVVLGAEGEAVVKLPNWFEALNHHFRYHLTALGAPGPNLHIAEKIAGNCFRIAGGSPGLEVSWQVTGERHGTFALENPLQVEMDK